MTTDQPTEIKTTQAMMVAIDGPREKPNGRLLVEVLGPDTRPHAFRCRVVSILQSSGRTCKVGDVIIVVEGHNLEEVTV